MGFERISIAMSYLQLITNIRINPLRYTKEKIEINKFANRLNYEQSIILLAMELAESINYANSNECLAVYKGYTEKNKRTINKYNEEFLNGCFDLLKRRGIFYKKYSNPIKLWFVETYKRNEFKTIYKESINNTKNKEVKINVQSNSKEEKSQRKSTKSDKNNDEKVFTFNRGTGSFCICNKHDINPSINNITNSKSTLNKSYHDDDYFSSNRFGFWLNDPVFYVLYLNYLNDRNEALESVDKDELTREINTEISPNYDDCNVSSIHDSLIDSLTNTSDQSVDDRFEDYGTVLNSIAEPCEKYVKTEYYKNDSSNDYFGESSGYSSSGNDSYSGGSVYSSSSDYSSSSSDYSSSSSSSDY